MCQPRERLNPFFRLPAGGGAVFVVTVLALVAAPLGHPKSPAVRFL